MMPMEHHEGLRQRPPCMPGDVDIGAGGGRNGPAAAFIGHNEHGPQVRLSEPLCRARGLEVAVLACEWSGSPRGPRREIHPYGPKSKSPNGPREQVKKHEYVEGGRELKDS